MSGPPAHVRAVVDTNVLLSGLLSATGPPGKIVDAIRGGRFKLVDSPSVLDELLDVLPRPYLGVSVREAATIVATVTWGVPSMVRRLRPVQCLDMTRKSWT